MTALHSLIDSMLILLGIVASCETVMRLPISNTLSDTRALFLLRLPLLRSSRISDHWKARVARVYAWRALRLAGRFASFLLVGLLPALAGLWFSLRSIDSVIEFSISGRFLGSALCCSVVYLSMRFWMRSRG